MAYSNKFKLLKCNRFFKISLLAASLSCATTAAYAETILKAVMHSDLRITDPIMTTAHITRDHAYMIYDVLVALNSKGEAKPQMADWAISDDGLVYSFTLRDGLKFHDGAPVTATDVVASLRRWGERDNAGQYLIEDTVSLVAADEKTVVWTLKKPFGQLIDVLAKESSIPAFIMPERVAKIPSNQPLTEFVGSGPFKLVVSEFKPGIGALYEKFEDYVPRNEPADGMAGGKVVYVDKVQWITMPDVQTSINALLSDEIDYLELLPVDLIAMVEGDDHIVTGKRSAYGLQSMGRMNFKYPPFDNIKIRQAAVYAISQEPILANMVSDPKYYKVCGAVLGCDTPLGSEAGTATLVAGGDVEKAKALLKEAGYDGTPVVIMRPTDNQSTGVPAIVVAQQLRKAGFTVDLQTMDWQTLVARRASMASPKDGGWSMFFTNWILPEIMTPLNNPMLNGRGDSGWFGWPVDPELEALKQQFISSKTNAERKEIADKIQVHNMDFVDYIPLGEFQFPQAYNVKLTDMLPTAIPVFWNVKKAQ